MNAITNLNQTTSEEVRQLLEMHGILINKTDNDRFIIVCPSCEKPEAFIYHNQGTRNIKCNRGNKCGIETELWHYIADKQGINAQNNFEMLKYINEILGYEFKHEHAERYNIEREERSKEQKFLADCNHIFFNALNNSKDNEQVHFSLMYLQQRGYSKEYIKQFCLGFFPDYNDLLSSLVTGYNYTQDLAVELMTKYFSNILNNNGHLNNNSEEDKNRITVTWSNNRSEIAGFIIRKPTNQNVNYKYLYNNEMRPSEVLFNLNTLNIQDKKTLVVLEGAFDALTASYLSTEDVRQQYHFVACGKSTLSARQVELIKNKGYLQVILFLDNDEAGKKFFSSVSKLREYDTTSFVALIPDEYEAKDLDELIRKYPATNLQAILDNARYAINVQIDLTIKNNSKNHESLTDREKDTIITECSKLKSSLLMSEHEPYRKAMYEKLGVHVDYEERAQDSTKKSEYSTETGGNVKDIKSELEKLKLNVKQKIDEAEADTTNGETSTIDIHEFRKRAYEIQKLILQDNIAEGNEKGSRLKTLDDILANIEKYNKLLTTNYEEDKSYTSEQLLQKVLQNPAGMKTGFAILDKDVTIQPASVAFIAGKPSHGKTTMMLNMLRNMIVANPDKSFLFYSYEETVDQIWLKIILGIIELHNDINKEENKTYLSTIINQLKSYKMSRVKAEENGTISTSSISLDKAYYEVKGWIDEERLQILDRKPNVEVLTSAIIERANKSEKPVAAIFIDYVQKLSTEKERVNRQQELQRVCEILLDTALDKRVNAAIILGAQVNREVKSLDTLTLSNIREAADIEHVANLVLGVWDDQAAQLDYLRYILQEVENKLTMATINDNPAEINRFQATLAKVKEKLRAAEGTGKNKDEKQVTTTKQIKILKNRNGKKDVTIDLCNYPDLFLITNFS